MKYFKIILSVGLLLLISNCTKDKHSPIENDGVPPGQITNTQVERLSGAVKITYSLPNDQDLLYAKAVFTDKNGETYEFKASYYSNSLILEGFSDTSVYQVKLYAVDRGENASQPTLIDVKPLLPPYITVKETLSSRQDFGGINIRALNISDAELAYVVCTRDSFGDFVINDTYYSKLDTIDFSIRGLDSIPTDFAIYIRDRWNHRSDTVFTTITPLYEKELSKSKFKAVFLPGDINYGWGLPMPFLWDGIISPGWNMWHSQDPVPGFPIWITFDLGVSAKLSRFILFQRPGDWLYTHGNPKEYEVYGSESPNPDGSWDSWTQLSGRCISVKPSGQPAGQNSSEDIAAAAAGEEWNVPLDAPKVRYIRVKIYSTWAGGLAAHIAEMNFYGNDNL